MKESYPQAFNFAMSWEKWIADDKDDPGGLTIWGVTTKFFPEVVEKLKDMTKEQSREYVKDNFYYEKFWVRFGCDDLPYPIDICMFDFAMNSEKGAKWVMEQKPLSWLDFLFLRLVYYQEHTNPKWINGLKNRCVALRRVLKKETP